MLYYENIRLFPSVYFSVALKITIILHLQENGIRNEKTSFTTVSGIETLQSQSRRKRCGKPISHIETHSTEKA